MASIDIIIKNGGKSYDLQISEEDNGLVLKNQIFSLTNIPPDRQKILLKGGQLKDDTVLSAYNFKPKQAVMVLGTPDSQLPKKPVQQTKFLEDLTASDLKVDSQEPTGLTNLGNTCYLNSSLQALYDIKDVRDKVLAANTSVKPSGTPENLFDALQQTFRNMGKKKDSIPPILLLSSLRRLYPQFAETNNHGQFKQQDAEEAFSQILNVVRGQSKLDDLFKIEFKVQSKCLQTTEEPTFNYEDSFKLNCHINVSTNFLRDGILNGLKETVEKYNESLSSNADYELSRTITKLPKILTVHFVRFFWRRDTQKKSKILRKVQFPFELDLSEFLDESIKQEKIQVRESIRNIEKDKLETTRDFKKSKKNESGLNPLQLQKENEAKIKSINEKFDVDFKSILPAGYDLSKNENPSSLYELSAIITHQGSSADSGHYQCFVKDRNDLDGDRWWKFNDDRVTSVPSEKIQQLAGGGESDSALILLYKGFGLN